MRREMDRIWDRFSKDFSSSTVEQHWNPSLDLVSVTGDTLAITGEKKQKADKTGKNYHITERIYGKFSRSIRLPATVDPDRVEAHYKDGILSVTLGKAESIKSKRIEVKTA
jgi:HSP20 family protein